MDNDPNHLANFENGISAEQFIEWLQTLPYEAQSATMRVPNSAESNMVRYATYYPDTNEIGLGD